MNLSSRIPSGFREMKSASRLCFRCYAENIVRCRASTAPCRAAESGQTCRQELDYSNTTAIQQYVVHSYSLVLKVMCAVGTWRSSTWIERPASQRSRLIAEFSRTKIKPQYAICSLEHETRNISRFPLVLLGLGGGTSKYRLCRGWRVSSKNPQNVVRPFHAPGPNLPSGHSLTASP